MTKQHFRVEWTTTAINDVEKIIEYIYFENTSAAIMILDTITNRALSLNQFPERGRFVPELVETRSETYPELIISPYRLIYRIDDQTKIVLVVGVYDGRRHLEEILFERLSQI